VGKERLCEELQKQKKDADQVGQEPGRTSWSRRNKVKGMRKAAGAIEEEKKN
jgi:hypothetical protein